MAEPAYVKPWWKRPGWWGLLLVTGLLLLLFFGADNGGSSNKLKLKFWEDKEQPAVVSAPMDSKAFLREQEIIDRLIALDARVAALEVKIDECCCKKAAPAKPAKKKATMQPKQRVLKKYTAAPTVPSGRPQKLVIPLAKLPGVTGCTKPEGCSSTPKR